MSESRLARLGALRIRRHAAFPCGAWMSARAAVVRVAACGACGRRRMRRFAPLAIRSLPDDEGATGPAARRVRGLLPSLEFVIEVDAEAFSVLDVRDGIDQVEACNNSQV